MRPKRTAWKVLTVAFVSFLGATQFAKPARSQAGGEALYKTKCAACHGSDGKGETTTGKANKLRDLASADVLKQSDDELSGIISAGKGKMPAYSKSLKPEQIKDLVTFIRTLKK
jgi:mono/diheme cytochrome c family protein